MQGGGFFAQAAEEDDEGFFALLQAAEDGEGVAVLPGAIPEDVPTEYAVPQDRVGVAGNQSLSRTYGIMAEWVNDVLSRRRTELKLKDDKLKSHRAETEVTVKLIIKLNSEVVNQVKKIHDNGHLAFDIPEAMQLALKYILP